MKRSRGKNGTVCCSSLTGDHIVWIPGRRMSRAYQVSSRTEKILEIKITEEMGNGRDDQGFSPGGES